MSKTNALASILTRKLAWIAVVVLLINATAVALYYGSNRSELEQEVIAEQMLQLETALDKHSLSIRAAARQLYAEYPDHYAFALLDGSGAVRDSENLDLIPSQALKTGTFAQDWITRLTLTTHPLLVASHKIHFAEQPLRLVFVMADDPAGLLHDALLSEFMQHIWLPVLPIALILIAANALILRRSIRPVTVAAAWARSVEPGKTVPSIPQSRYPAEIHDLMQATQRALERLNEALAAEKRRTAEVAHALRTPVAVLVARMDALPQGEHTERLRSDLGHLSRIVNQLLACARADAFTANVEQPAELNHVAAEVIEAIAPYAFQRGLLLALNPSAEPNWVKADAAAVNLALTNLVENAIVHAGQGTVEITIGPGPCIRVTDQGAGLSDEALVRILDPYWRSPDAVPGGAGLGMAIVDRIQRAFGGSIQVANSPAGGAEFILYYRS